MPARPRSRSLCRASFRQDPLHPLADIPNFDIRKGPLRKHRVVYREHFVLAQYLQYVQQHPKVVIASKYLGDAPLTSRLL